MKRIHIENEFTQWAEYLARYFGHDLLIYDVNGDLMWGAPAYLHIDPAEFNESKRKKVKRYLPVFKGFEPIAYLEIIMLSPKEQELLRAIVPFIESQLDEEEGA